MLRKLPGTCAFIGKVSDDMFGRRLKTIAEGAGIDMSALRMDANVRTTLAFVRTDENGDRDFSFYRNPGALDAFGASVLNFIPEHGLNDLTEDDLKAMLRFADAAACLVTAKKGAIHSMPERAQAQAILKEH